MPPHLQAESRSQTEWPGSHPLRKTPNAASHRRPALYLGRPSHRQVRLAPASGHDIEAAQQRLAVGAHRHNPVAFSARPCGFRPIHSFGKMQAQFVNPLLQRNIVPELAPAGYCDRNLVPASARCAARRSSPRFRRKTTRPRSTICPHGPRDCGLTRPETLTSSPIGGPTWESANRPLYLIRHRRRRPLLQLP